MQSTVRMAETLGMSCVAEGVETARIRNILRELGCDLQQGYHFGRPMPTEEFVAQIEGRVPPVWTQPLQAV